MRTLRQMEESGEFFKLKQVLRDFQPSELVALIEEEEEREQLIIFRLLPLKPPPKPETLEWFDQLGFLVCL